MGRSKCGVAKKTGSVSPGNPERIRRSRRKGMTMDGKADGRKARGLMMICDGCGLCFPLRK